MSRSFYNINLLFLFLDFIFIVLIDLGLQRNANDLIFLRVEERVDESHVYIYLSIFTSISLVCRHLLAYIYIPVIQRELDVFWASVWNSHRIRKQKKKELPTRVPDHIYHCPEEYGSEKCGLQVSDNDLREVAEIQMSLMALMLI